MESDPSHPARRAREPRGHQVRHDPHLQLLPHRGEQRPHQTQGGAEAKIHAFIEMLGADARLLTEGEEIKSHDLFAKLNSKKTITGEDEEEESELEYLTEIREVRDKQPELFARIKRLPKKARSTRLLRTAPDAVVKQFPSLLTYFRQGTTRQILPGSSKAQLTLPNWTFLTAVKILKPGRPIREAADNPAGFLYSARQKQGRFRTIATSPENDDAIPRHKGGANDAYILKRLKAKEIRRYHGFTEDDEAVHPAGDSTSD